MTGPEHYREAERLLLSCQLAAATEDNAATYPGLECGVDSTTHALMAAQVHATLALTAATAFPFERSDDWFPPNSISAWDEVFRS